MQDTFNKGGAFLIMRSEIDEPGIPRGLAIIGSDDSRAEYSMRYFDEREVSRKYEIVRNDNVWKWWRNALISHNTSQVRSLMTGTIVGKGELSKDEVSWEKDLELTYWKTC